MTEEQIKNTIAFMGRVQLQWSEVPAFTDCINGLQSLLTLNNKEDDKNN